MILCPCLDIPITCKHTSVFCQSEYACLHKVVNMVVFLVENNDYTYPKERALMQIYSFFPQTKKGK